MSVRAFGGGRSGYVFGAEVLRLPRSAALRADGWNRMTSLGGQFSIALERSFPGAPGSSA